MVAIGRALMAEPRLLAIDELSLGLAPLLVQQLAEFLLNEEDGVAILLVDQSAALAFSLCERAYVLETGRVVLDGTSSDLQGRDEVRALPRWGLGGRGVTTFFQLVVVGISTGSVFAIVGMSLVLVYRATGIVNFAQGVFAVLAGLLTYSLGKHVSLVVAAVLATLLTAFVATLVAVVAVGIRGRTTPLASLIVTVGIALLAEAVLLASFGEVPRSYSAVSDTAWDVGGVLVQPQYAVLAASRSPRHSGSRSSFAGRSSARRWSRPRTRRAPRS